MSFIKTDDKVKLYYETVGKGEPIIFVHEFAGDYRSWEPQVNYFSRYNINVLLIVQEAIFLQKFPIIKRNIAKRELGAI